MTTTTKDILNCLLLLQFALIVPCHEAYLFTPLHISNHNKAFISHHRLQRINAITYHTSTRRANGRILFSAPPKDNNIETTTTNQLDDDDGDNQLVKLSSLIEKHAVEQDNDEHSLWYKRLVKEKKEHDEMMMEKLEIMSDDDFVLVDEEEIANDPTLNVMSSELGVNELVHGKATLHLSNFPLLYVLLERTLDTIEDIIVHLRRIPYEKGIKTLSLDEELTRKTIVVLGSGWAAHAFMKVADCNKLRIIVVSPSNHFVFTPMLASAAVGTVEYRSMTEAVRSANPMIDQYIEGYATDIDVQKKSVTVQLNTLLSEENRMQDDDNNGSVCASPPNITLDYDHLIVSVGCKVDDKGVPGAANRALRLKSCDDARRLRTAVGECFEYASRPDVCSVGENQDAATTMEEERTRRATFLVVGGGATGVELAGELHDLAEDITRPFKGTYPKLAGNVRVILVHSGSELVPQFDENLRMEALKSLKKKNVNVILNTRVSEVGDGFVKLRTKVTDEETTGDILRWDESVLPVGLTIWCAGTAPVPFIDKLLHQLPESARNYDGRIKVDKYMRPSMMDDGGKSEFGSILVLGDAAAFSEQEVADDTDETETTYLPQTAQVAGQQGAYVARLLDRGYDLSTKQPILPCTPLAPDTCDVFYDPLINEWLDLRGLDIAPQFVFLNLGLLAYLGGGEALSQVQVGDVPIFAYGGSVAFVLWRSVYLVKQVATKNRILVTFDWIKSALFGRDMTRL